MSKSADPASQAALLRDEVRYLKAVREQQYATIQALKAEREVRARTVRCCRLCPAQPLLACEECGESFTAKRVGQRLCSKDCVRANQNAEREREARGRLLEVLRRLHDREGWSCERIGDLLDLSRTRISQLLAELRSTRVPGEFE